MDPKYPSPPKMSSFLPQEETADSPGQASGPLMQTVVIEEKTPIVPVQQPAPTQSAPSLIETVSQPAVVEKEELPSPTQFPTKISTLPSQTQIKSVDVISPPGEKITTSVKGTKVKPKKMITKDYSEPRISKKVSVTMVLIGLLLVGLALVVHLVLSQNILERLSNTLFLRESSNQIKSPLVE